MGFPSIHTYKDTAHLDFNLLKGVFLIRWLPGSLLWWRILGTDFLLLSWKGLSGPEGCKGGSWLREIHSCSCLALPCAPDWVLLSKICIPYLKPLYSFLLIYLMLSPDVWRRFRDPFCISQVPYCFCCICTNFRRTGNGLPGKRPA